MKTRYVAYGLELYSSFRLSGMTPAAREGLPSLVLELATPSELTTSWSGPEGSPEWRGRLGDGCELSIERGIAEDLLFSYGDRARFLLDASGRSLTCAPRRAGLDWQRALLGKVLPSISVKRGYEALHASAVESPQGVVAVLAPSGMGKTTLAIELMRRGWPLFADDVLTLSDVGGDVWAHPGTPHMNVAESQTEAVAREQIGATRGILAGERWVAAPAETHEPRTVRLLCLLERCSAFSLDAQVLAPSPLPLAPYMLGLSGDAGRARRRFALYANLMSSTTLMRLSCGDGDGPGDLADLIEQALAVAGPTFALGARYEPALS
jgi:hypothetical protein